MQATEGCFVCEEAAIFRSRDPCVSNPQAPYLQHSSGALYIASNTGLEKPCRVCSLSDILGKVHKVWARDRLGNQNMRENRNSVLCLFRDPCFIPNCHMTLISAYSITCIQSNSLQLSLKIVGRDSPLTMQEAGSRLLACRLVPSRSQV